MGGRLWRQPRTGGGRRPSIGIGRGGGGATRPQALRDSSQSGAGLRALGPRGSSGGGGGSRTRWTPVTAVNSCVRRKVCTPSCAAGAGRGGRGAGAAP